MAKTAPNLGPKLQAIRKEKSLTLEQLAERSSVSKSMLSQIERGQANPTFATLWNMTQALGVDIAALTGSDEMAAVAPSAIEYVETNFTPTIKSPDGKCLLRILSPARSAGDIEWYELIMEPGARLESEAHAPGCMEHFTAIDAGILIESGGRQQRLKAGDTARYPADVPHCTR